ncbi:hypothetical protein [Streptomyces scabiei]|uniref:hypothetical protein n=1 Tax=Streptomyces scabiei TaxID=1930 RepID=UPI0029C06DB5|nr:hypothetical protein [Streptomyces scabiei]
MGHRPHRAPARAADPEALTESLFTEHEPVGKRITARVALPDAHNGADARR